MNCDCKMTEKGITYCPLHQAASKMYEALKVAEARIYTELLYHPEVGDYRKRLQDELRQVTKALAEADGKV